MKKSGRDGIKNRNITKNVKGIFITGTDTGVGKTVVTGLLGRYLLSKGYGVITQKWVTTGTKGTADDIDLHLKSMKIKKNNIKDYLPHISPYRFGFASSPHLAARLEKRKISPDKIKKSFKFLSKTFGFVIAEGTGGALAPFNERKLVIDIAKELNLPVLIVAGNKLGAINHTLLTIEAIKRRNMRFLGIVFNNLSQENKIILKDNPRIVNRLTGKRIFGALPRKKNVRQLYQAFKPIGARVLRTTWQF